MRVSAALFDLGRTLVRGDPAVMFARYLRERGRFPDASWRLLEEALRAYHAGGDQDQAVDRANAAFASAFAGLRPDAVAELARDKVRAGAGDDYYAYARPLVAQVRRLGYRAAAVTGVAEPLASEIARDLGIDETYGTALEVDGEGRLTGRTRFEARPGWKLARVRHLLDGPGGAAEALAFGDSEADLPVLEVVGRPVVVNARGAFAQRVRALGWPLFGEGDDVAGALSGLVAGRPWNAARTGAFQGATQPAPSPRGVRGRGEPGRG